MAVNRRTFLKTSGAAAAGVTVISLAPDLCLAPLLEERRGSAGAPDAEEEIVPSVCLQCPGACGILVRVVNGRAVKVEGNLIGLRSLVHFL